MGWLLAPAVVHNWMILAIIGFEVLVVGIIFYLWGRLDIHSHDG